MNEQQNQIKQQIIQVINKIIFKEKKRILKYEGISLYPSEVHMLLVIQNDIATNATSIAKQLGLSKGAVSQTLSRLEKKGIIIKEKDPYSKNELTLTLTAFGEMAYGFCQSKQDCFFQTHDKYLATLDFGEKEVIFGFLKHLEKAVDELDLT